MENRVWKNVYCLGTFATSALICAHLGFPLGDPFPYPAPTVNLHGLIAKLQAPYIANPSLQLQDVPPMMRGVRDGVWGAL